MLAEGIIVVSGDLLQTGESAECKQKRLNGGTDAQPILPYHTTFNYTIDAYRIQDVCLLSQMLATCYHDLTLWAEGCAARAATCAAALMSCFKTVKLESDALKLEGDEAYFEKFFVPGICALGGLEGCLGMIKGEVQLFTEEN